MYRLLGRRRDLALKGLKLYQLLPFCRQGWRKHSPGPGPLRWLIYQVLVTLGLRRKRKQRKRKKKIRGGEWGGGRC